MSKTKEYKIPEKFTDEFIQKEYDKIVDKYNAFVNNNRTLQEDFNWKQKGIDSIIACDPHLQQNIIARMRDYNLQNLENLKFNITKKMMENNKELDLYKEELKSLKAILSIPPIERVERRYLVILNKKKKASTDQEYQNIIPEFDDIIGYKDTEELKSECEKLCNELRERRLERERQERIRREEQERQERIRRAEQEKKDREERERREAEARELARIKAEERKKQNKIAAIIMLPLFAIIIGYVLYNSQKNVLVITDDITAISDNQYTRKQLVSVDIPDSVTSIGANAFKTNKLTTILLPDSITSIGDNAFDKNKIISITIGSNVTLGNDTFKNGFEDVYTSNGMGAGTYKRDDHKTNIWTIWHGNFSYINQNGSITITGYDGTGGELEIPLDINGNQISTIGVQAFFDKEITSTVIPNTIKFIGKEAFRNNRLTSLVIGNNVTYIGDNAFDENFLTSIIIPNSVITIGSNAFCCNLLTSLTLGNNVKTIGQSAFTGSGVLRNNKLTRIVIPNSVTDIGVGAFRQNQLTSISIGNNVKTIGSGAFRENKIVSVRIPNNVTSIGNTAFYKNQINNIELGAGITAIGENVFRDNKLSSIYIPNNVKSIAVNAFTDNSITSIRLGENVTLGSDGNSGILGINNGFNSAYNNAGRRQAGTYSRRNTNTTTWSRK